MEKSKKKGNLFWNFIDRFQGDRVVWMIVILLILISLVTIFSSTSLLAAQKHTDRVNILREQGMIVGIGLVLIIVCYNIRNIEIFRKLGQWGFALSLFLLMLLVIRRPIIPFVRPAVVNHAWRILSVFGFQIHVFEVVKVLMVLYLSWAVDAYRYDGFTLAKRIAGKWSRLGWLVSPLGLRCFYLYAPILIVCGLILTGSVSSALFIGAILYVTVLIGGVSIRDVVLPGIVMVVMLIGAVGVYKITDGKVFNRLGTAATRLSSTDDSNERILNDPTLVGTTAYEQARDELSQPYSAKLAIREGRIFGKGPGESTQRYVVPIMYSDYMYSFIIEEYGLIGGIFIIILFASLMARGAMISRWLNDYFAKTAVAGLVVLTVGQAFMHMAINLDLVPRTGQTLPMISHGNSSFLAFSFVFGVILAMSRQAWKDHNEQLDYEKSKTGEEAAA